MQIFIPKVCTDSHSNVIESSIPYEGLQKGVPAKSVGLKSKLESVQDFLIKLDMKPCMHLAETSIFSLNPVTVRPTKNMNRANKNCSRF